jgi:uncharacterized repeat protein (TIGR03803 family)
MKLKTTLFLLLSFLTTVTIAQTQELWGMTYSGGEYNTGTIFKTDINGDNHEVKQGWTKLEGESPFFSDLLHASNGKFYGLTKLGGANDLGVLFEWDPSNETYTKKIDFDGVTNGSSPYGSIMEASNGKFYAMTSAGGSNNLGVLFEWDPSSDTYTKKIDFDGANNGAAPQGSLMQADNGKLYGMTSTGGVNDQGVLFEWDPSNNTYSKKIDFDGVNNGYYPQGSLMQANNGKLYGMTGAGGSNNLGVLFEWDPSSDAYTKKLDFDGINNGKSPSGSLMEASNGKLYGMTRQGGSNDEGVLFEWDLSNDTYVKKIDFDGWNIGGAPYGNLMEASNGKFYGMTYGGGMYFKGVLFEWNPSSDTYTKKLDFDGVNNGARPFGSLMETNDGKLYGMCSQGGVNDRGVLFEWNATNEMYTKKLDFAGAINGENPNGSLIEASNGKLYGTTRDGGAYGFGVLFEWNPSSDTYIKKLDFDGVNNGKYPYGGLMETSDGKLYGMTPNGGLNDGGVLFEWDPLNDVYIKKLDFDGANNGQSPNGSLMEASNGKLYGMTSFGGTNNLGVLFEWDPSNDSYLKKLDFDGANNGQTPYGSLTEASNGKFYGMTYSGGVNGVGVLFEWDPSNDTYMKKFEFDVGNNGYIPFGSLMKASNGKLYGMTLYGGSNDMGVLFEWDPSNDSYVKKLDFDGWNTGGEPYGNLMEASNGKFYGMTGFGGVYNLGVLFEWDPANDTYTKKLDYNGENGSYPRNGQLIEVSVCRNTTQTISAVSCDSYTVPSGDEFHTVSGQYFDTIPNQCGSDSIIAINLTITEVDYSMTLMNDDSLVANQVGASYQWIDCGNGDVPIPGATNQSYVPTGDGDYAVIVTMNNCSGTSNCESTLDIKESKTFDFSIFPNPSNGIFSIQTNAIGGTVSVISIDGRIIESNKLIQSKNTEMNLSKLESGTYLLKIKKENQESVERIVIR